MRPWSTFVSIALAVTLAGCASKADSDAGQRADSGVDAGDAGEGGATCTLAMTGSFTFHVHNAGTSTLIIDLGCGHTSPIELDTPDGARAAGPGNVDVCEFSCDTVYAGRAMPGGCTDCGGGVQRSIAPGATVDVGWDRRVYVEQPVDPACSTAQGTCAFGIFVVPTLDQTGRLTTCPIDQHPTASCLQPTLTSFDVDTTGADATIDVGP